MLPLTLGGLGIGLVWGWIVAGLRGPYARPLRGVLAVLAATGVLGVVVLWRAGNEAALAYLGAAAFAWWVHAAWQRQLRTRYGSGLAPQLRSPGG